MATSVSPNFHPYAMPSALLATTFPATFSISPRFCAISSCAAAGADDNFAVSEPDAFSEKSKNGWSMCSIWWSISFRYRYVNAWPMALLASPTQK